MALGAGGSRKSTSLLNFDNGVAKVLSATGKRMPFCASMEVQKNATYREIYDVLCVNDSKVYVTDDSTYIVQSDNFKHVQEKG